MGKGETATMTENVKPDLDRIGLFKEMSYMHGVEYEPYNAIPVFNEDASKGKQIMSKCTKSKTGTQDGYFERHFPRAFESEAYTDRLQLQRKYRLENEKKIIGEIFRMPSPTKVKNGVGSWYGTFREYEKDRREDPFAYVSKERPREEPIHEAPNFKTNPAKKGSGYGYTGITIGKLPPFYVEDEYSNLTKKRKGSERWRRSLLTQDKPFVAGTPHNDFFDPNPFEEVEVMARRRWSRRMSAMDEELITERKPFKPTNPSKKAGGMKAGCFSKFPEYSIEMPERRERFTESAEEPTVEEKPPFKIKHRQTVYPIKSILEANVKKEINVNNYMKTRGVIYCDKNVSGFN